MEEPLLILSAAPCEAAQITSFFEMGEKSVYSLLKNPPKIRDYGWDLTTLDTPQIIKGECWAVANGDRKFIRVYEDGTVIFKGTADSSFLGWGQDPDKFLLNPRLNPIAVIELFYNFVQFIRVLGEFYSLPPKNIHFQIDVKNAWFGKNAKLFLIPGSVDSFDNQFNRTDQKKEALDKEITKEKTVPLMDVNQKPEYVCFELVKLFYLRFGINPEGIPYAAQDNTGSRFIDKNIIKKGN
jgi:hypothetical protein